VKLYPGVLFGMLLVACSGGDSGDDDATGGADASTQPPAEKYEIAWGPITVPSGTENVQCVNVRLGNDVPVKIRQITNALGNASHHFIVYKTNETEEYSTPRNCNSIESLVNAETGVPLMITQKAEETLTLPDGVAFELEANQMIKLELHYINASDTPQQLRVDSTFVPMAEADFEFAADFMFMGNPDIEIGPGQSFTLGPSFFPMPWELLGAKIFGVTGHEHQWGTNVYVEVTDGVTSTPIYDLPNFNWDEPETVYYAPPIELPEAGGFRFTCEWENKSNRSVGFGEGVDDEMCFFWAYYYPSRGAITCFHSEQVGDTIDICCPGPQLCNLVDDFYN
jgi:hypothetical protein